MKERKLNNVLIASAGLGEAINEDVDDEHFEKLTVDNENIPNIVKYIFVSIGKNHNAI